MSKEKKLKMLFVASGPAAPGTTPQDNPFYYLSKYFEGYVIGATWSSSKQDADKYAESIQSSFKDFTYKPSPLPTYTGILKQVTQFYRFYKNAKEIIESEKIDVICSYGFFIPGLISSLLSKKYHIPLLIEVPGVPDRAIEFSELRIKAFAKLVQNLIIRVCLKQADAIWLLFPSQLKNYTIPENTKVFVGHEFTPIKMYTSHEVSEPIISFLGYPWKLKGVDILIKAFKLIYAKHPHATLRIAGYCPDKEEFELLRKGMEHAIQFVDPMPREKAVEFIKQTKIFVLPSRTEAMGRVLLEAAAAKKGIIASEVDGIPHYIINNKTGLLFKNEDINDLAEKLDILLSDQALYNRLSIQACTHVNEKYTEELYAIGVYQMVESIV